MVGAMPATASSPLTSPANFVVGSSTTTHDEPTNLGRAAERPTGNQESRVEDPATTGLTRAKTERPIAHRVRVVRGASHVRARHVREQVRRKNRQLGEHRWKCRRRGREPDLNGRVVDSVTSR